MADHQHSASAIDVGITITIYMSIRYHENAIEGLWPLREWEMSHIRGILNSRMTHDSTALLCWKLF